MHRKMDLRSGWPVWFAYRAPTVPTSSLTSDVKADVAIVGMGISGAMIAEMLTARGMSVVCLDRRGPLKGSTLATTALVQFEIDEALSTLSRMIGKTPAQQAWRRSRLGVLNLQARISQLAINCSATSKPSLYLAGRTLGPSQLKREAEARQLAGISANYLSRNALSEQFGINRKGAILSYGNLAVDPRKLTAGLLLKAAGRKARFYVPVEAISVEDTQQEVVVATKDGPTVTAKHLVLATGYELLPPVPAKKHVIQSTWAIATRPQKSVVWPTEAFIWEASDPYLYMRTTADGRVICGGEDEAITDEDSRDGLLGRKSRRLSKKLKNLLPSLDTEPEFAWTAAFGSTSTGLPYIGALPQHPRILAVMGYGGNGITYSQIASEIISATLAGLEDADKDLFSFGR